MKTTFLLLTSVALMIGLSLTAAPLLTLTPLGTVKSGVFRPDDPRIAEINAFDPEGQRIYVVNPSDGRIDIINASNPSAPVGAGFLDIAGACKLEIGAECPLQSGLEPNSVAIHGNLMAVAASNAVKTNNGHAVFFELRGIDTPRFLHAVEVGAVPDMIVFTDDGKYALTANEGEPNSTYTIDPPGSVSVIEIEKLGTPRAARHVLFDRFDNPDQRAKIESEGVRIFGPGASVAEDLEPEYIAVSGNKAYVTLQENNAMAIINIAGATVEKIVGLGLKDHSLPGNTLDAHDTDGINLKNWPIFGLYQADAIAAFNVKGRTFLMMANEGDAREYVPGYVEAIRLGNVNYALDPAVFNVASLKANTALARLNVSIASGDANHDGLYERIDVFGGRSVSIRDHQGNIVWDSGDLFERMSRQNDLASINLFNTTHTANSRDNRSDDKGIEPESVVIGAVGGRDYAFVGLERDSGIVVFDISDPAAPTMVTYALNRKFPRNAAGALLPCNDTNDCGDLGPEGLTFVPAASSPIGKALLIVSNEASSTTTIWKVE
jgi:DNA-binding beta-propeller fold protein YncE